MTIILKEIPSFNISLSHTPDKAETAYLHERIKAFNNQVSPHHKAIRPVGTQPLNIFVRNRAGELQGGLTASSYWEWLEVDDFWLAESLRGQGLGREILLAAETEAIARGCKRAKLETFSFQARAFYEKLGYFVVGELKDYPPGASMFWMRKDF